MTAQGFHLEPEIEGLIQEIGRDPRSSFFQVERPKSPRGLLQAWDRYSPVSAGWTAAERHLMTAHREDLAFCLRTRVLMESLRLRPLSVFVDHRRSVDDVSSMPSDAEWRQSASRAVRLARLDDAPEADLVVRLLAERELTVEELYDVALITVRLTPNDTAWLRIGLALNLRGDPHSAIQLLTARERLAGSELMRSYMWDNIGVAYSMLGDHAAAREAYKKACSLGPLRVSPLASLLYQSLLSGDPIASERACNRIDEEVEPGHPALLHFLDGLRRARTAGLWNPSSEAQQLTNRLESSHGPTTQSIVHAAS
jgi:hypothetical protein